MALVSFIRLCIFFVLFAVTANTAKANNAPTAFAGQDITVYLPTDSIVLNGSGSDPDGQSVHFLWQFVSGPSGYLISNPAIQNPVVKNLLEGVYLFELIVTDEDNAVGRDTIQINVNTIQRLLLDFGPISTSSPDQWGKYWNNISNTRAGVQLSNAHTIQNAVTTISFQVITKIDQSGGSGVNTGNSVGIVGDYPATATTDYSFSSGTITGKWKFSGLNPQNAYTIKFWGSSPGTVTRSIQIKRSDELTWQEYNSANNNNFSRSASFSFSGKAEMSFDIKTKTGSGYGFINVVDITVFNNSGQIQFPIANAGIDRSITLPKDSIKLDGSASYDPKGGALKYKWTKLSGPLFSINNDSMVNPVLTGFTTGMYSIELKVTDNAGLVGRDTVSLQVNGPSPDTVNCGRPFRIVVLGSSTAAGTGASPIDSSWVNRYIAYIKAKNPQNVLYNLGTGGYTTYEVLNPTGFIPPPGRPAPDPVKNITSALNLNPDAIIINLPSNDAYYNFSLKEQQDNYERAVALATQKGVKVWVTTTQPRTSLTAGQRDSLMRMRDWTLQRFGTYAIDFWTTVATSTGTINPVYNADGIHVNNAGHALFYSRVADERILDQLCSGPDTANRPPIAGAGNDIIIRLPLNTINLDGSTSSDIDGSIISYLWEKISGPGGASIGNSNSSQTMVTSLVLGTYAFSLTVIDDRGASSKDTIIVTVNPQLVNQLPVANAGTDQIITLPLDSVMLSGFGIDSDGTINSYHWQYLSGPTQYFILNPNASQTAVKSLTTGIYKFILIVTDDDGGLGKDTVSITVNDLPPPPPQATGRQRVLVDVGPTANNYGQTTPLRDSWGKYWNNMTRATPGISLSNMIDTANYSTTIGVEVINRIDGTFSLSGTGLNFDNSIGTVGDYPSTATFDNAFAHNSTTTGRWRIFGLDPSRNYRIKFWGTRAASGVRTIQIKRSTDLNWQEYDAVNNRDYNRSCIFQNITGVTEVSFDIRVKSGQTYGYISVIDIISSEMPSTTVRLTAESSIENKEGVEISPNPVHDKISLKWNNSYKGQIRIQFIDASGVVQKDITTIKSQFNYDTIIPLNDLTKGMFFLRIITNSQLETRKILKQ